MMTFACKRINKEDLIRCSFSLNKTEYNVLMFLLENEEELSVAEIAKRMNLERTTVQKAVKSLVEKDLVRRKQLNMEKGSYVFIYKIKQKKEIKQKLKTIISGWSEKVEKFISNI